MAAPSEEKESTTIAMVLGEWAEGQTEKFSPVHRINGFPFRVRMNRSGRGALISVICEKSSEAELWEYSATITQLWTCDQSSNTKHHVFCSWEKNSWKAETGRVYPGSSVQVTIAAKEGKKSWSSTLRPPLDSIKPADGILVIGEEKKEIRVNKEFLASQSPYFDRLFFGDFMEKHLEKIPIGDVEYEEFNNIIKMVYGSSDAFVRDRNLSRALDLADRFELKIVEEKVVNYLLSTFTSYTLVQKLLISQERNIPSLKNLSLNTSKLAEFKWMKKSPEYADFSDALKLEILDRMLDLAQEIEIRLF